MQEKIPNLITKEVVGEKIEKVSENNKIDIGLIEKKAIKEVLEEFNSIFPEGGVVEDYPMNKFRFWCGKSIAIVLEKYPQLESKVDIIKNDIWNELIYYLFSNRFLKVREKIQKENPEKISPYWIHRKNGGFGAFVGEFFRDNETKEINWEFIREKLNIPDEKWFFADRTPITLDIFIDKILKKLEELNPESFSPKWIFKNVYSNYQNILKRNNINWSDIVLKLPEKWQERWNYHEQKAKNLEKCLEELVAKLEELNPESFSPYWIQNNLSRSAEKNIRKIFRNQNGITDWSHFLNFLPEKWKSKFTYLERNNRTEEECLEELVAKLEELNPESFSPSWIEAKINPVYKRILILFRVEENRINWLSFISKLPQEWQNKWKFQEQKDRSFDECIQDLIITLENNDYSNFSPYWISKNNRPVYKKLREFLRQDKRDINWQEMLDHLPAKYTKLWREQGGVDNLWYENSEEIDNNLKQYQNKFYTVVYYSSLKEKSDRVIARKMVIELLKLVKSGNKKAQEWLINNLKFACDEWSIKHKDIHFLEFISSEESEKIIKKCIYRFRGDENSNFFSYLFKTLAKKYYSFIKYKGKTSYQDWKNTEKGEN